MVHQKKKNSVKNQLLHSMTPLRKINFYKNDVKFKQTKKSNLFPFKNPFWTSINACKFFIELFVLKLKKIFKKVANWVSVANLLRWDFMEFLIFQINSRTEILYTLFTERKEYLIFKMG